MKLPHPQPLSGQSYSAVELMPDNTTLILLDQRRLPVSEEYVKLREPAQVRRALEEMLVRGAPAIGLTAAYGMVLAAGQVSGDYVSQMEAEASALSQARPTAVNLAWALARMLRLCRAHAGRAPGERVEELAWEARRMHREDVAANRVIGHLGAAQVPDGAVILTHCNAGALATGGYGTALGVVRAAHELDKGILVLADETRPYLQGSRLTAWELQRDGIPVELITDASAGSFFARGQIDLALVGADRIAQNGDVANKIGTYTVACLAHAHQRPFYVAAPWSSLDLATATGAEIPIEERNPAELTQLCGQQLAPPAVPARNPSFDITPACLVSAIFTERGAIQPVAQAGLEALAD